MITSKVTSKGQVTIPKEVREALHVHPGDELAYEIQGTTVLVRRVQPFDRVWHESVASQLEEWNAPENDEAWSDL